MSLKRLPILVVLALAACEKPSDYLPKTPQVTTATAPGPEAILALRNAISPCEHAMDAAADAIADLAARSAALPESRQVIGVARTVCSQASEAVQVAPVWSRLKDPCAQAVYAREGVIDAALRMLNGQGGALGMHALRDRIKDQVSASRTCAAAIAAAEGA